MADPKPKGRNEEIEPSHYETLLVRLPIDMRDALRERAHVEERTQATVVRRALRSYLETPVGR